jgi:hypothetical protein
MLINSLLITAILSCQTDQFNFEINDIYSTMDYAYSLLDGVTNGQRSQNDWLRPEIDNLFAYIKQWVAHSHTKLCDENPRLDLLPEYQNIHRFFTDLKSHLNQFHPNHPIFDLDTFTVTSVPISTVKQLYRKSYSWYSGITRFYTGKEMKRLFDQEYLPQIYTQESALSHSALKFQPRLPDLPLSHLDESKAIQITDKMTDSEVSVLLSKYTLTANLTIIETPAKDFNDIVHVPTHLPRLARQGFKTEWKRYSNFLQVSPDPQDTPENPPNYIHDDNDLTFLLSEYIHRHNQWNQQRDTNTNTRVLVYMCNPLHYCGGTGDRINGLLSAFVLALFTDRIFLIHSNSPYDLKYLYEPNQIDWSIKYSEYLLIDELIMHIDKGEVFNADIENILNNPHKIIGFGSNIRIIKYLFRRGGGITGSLDKLRHVKYLTSKIFHFLFKESSFLKHHMELLKLDLFALNQPRIAMKGEEVLPPFIAIHFRMGNADLSKWYDPGRHQFRDLLMFLDCAERVMKEIGLDEAETLIVLSSDVEKSLLESALNQLGVDKLPIYKRLRIPTSDSAVVHVDRSSVSNQITGAVGIMANHALLQYAHGIVLSRSGFGETAAEIGRIRNSYFYDGCIKIDLSRSW